MLLYSKTSKYTNSGLSAGASGRGETPVSIPNTEVKSPCAYGTAGFPGGRVGRCRRSILSLLSKVQPHCRGGEIGRRTRLKIWREQSRGGSIPPNEFCHFYEPHFLLNPLQLLIPPLFTQIHSFPQSVSKIQYFLPKKTVNIIP